MSHDGALELVLGNSLGAIEAGRLAIMEHLEPSAPAPSAINRFEVIFEELISNTVRHGFTPGADQRIRVVVEVGPDSMTLTIEDEGVPFNPLRAPPPPPFESIETMKIGGLGISLVRSLSTALSYEAPSSDEERIDINGRPFEPNNRLKVTISTAA
jgi:serine/threonine-protein kinase RsbW